MLVSAITWLFACLILEQHKDLEELELLRREKQERELYKWECRLKEREEKQKRAEAEGQRTKEAKKSKQGKLPDNKKFLSLV